MSDYMTRRPCSLTKSCNAVCPSGYPLGDFFKFTRVLHLWTLQTKTIVVAILCGGGGLKPVNQTSTGKAACKPRLPLPIILGEFADGRL